MCGFPRTSGVHRISLQMLVNNGKIPYRASNKLLVLLCSTFIFFSTTLVTIKSVACSSAHPVIV